MIWLLGRLVPDDKTIADFRKDNGSAIRKVCAQFVALCRDMGLLTKASVAIDGSKFKAVNNRDRNFTRAKVERRRAQLEASVARYLSQLDTAGGIYRFWNGKRAIYAIVSGEQPTYNVGMRITKNRHDLIRGWQCDDGTQSAC